MCRPPGATTIYHLPQGTWGHYAWGPITNPCSVWVMHGNYANASFSKFSDQSGGCNDVTITVEANNPVFGVINITGPCSLGTTR